MSGDFILGVAVAVGVLAVVAGCYFMFYGDVREWDLHQMQSVRIMLTHAESFGATEPWQCATISLARECLDDALHDCNRHANIERARRALEHLLDVLDGGFRLSF